MKKKILLLITNGGNGGAQKVFHNLAIELSSKYDVVECVFDKSEADFVYKSHQPLIDLNYKSKGGIIGKVFNLFFRSWALRKIIKAQKIDICISHMDGANWVNVLAFHCARKVVCIHGSLSNDPNKAGIRRLVMNNILSAFLYRAADHIVAVSEGIKTELIGLGISSKRISAIPNFFYEKQIVEESMQALDSSMNELFTHHPVIIFSGRLSKQKNIEPIFSIYKGVLSKIPGAKLVLIGDGELREHLVNTSLKQGLKTYQYNSLDIYDESYDVYFLGHQKNPYQYLRRAKLSVLTSYFEGFPLVIGESLICGLPCVSVDCPTGPRQILAESESPQIISVPEFATYGILMPMLDGAENQIKHMDSWVNTIVLLLNDSNLLEKYSKLGIERMKVFSVERVMPRWQEIIEDEK